MQVGQTGSLAPKFITEIKEYNDLFKAIIPAEEKSREKSVDNLKTRIIEDYQPKSETSKILIYPSGLAPIVNEFENKKVLSKRLDHTDIKPVEEKSRGKVDNLKTRIIDDYQPKSKTSKGLVYPSGVDLIGPEFKTEIVISNKLKPIDIRPAKEKSKEKSVDNLTSRFKDIYYPRSKSSYGLVYPKGAEIFKEIINITNSSAPIDQNLPLAILQFALSHANYEDLVSASMASKYWRYASLALAKMQESSLIKYFGTFLSESISENYLDQGGKILEVTNNVDFSCVKDYSGLKSTLLQSRLKIIEILSQLSPTCLEKLEVSCLMIKKPLTFDVLFRLVELQRGFKIAKDSWRIDCLNSIKQFCKLGALDMALNCFKMIEAYFKENPELNDFGRLHELMIKLLIKSGDFDKLMEFLLSKDDVHSMRRVIRNLLLMGKVEEGIHFTRTLSDRYMENLGNIVFIAQIILKKNNQSIPLLELDSLTRIQKEKIRSIFYRGELIKITLEDYVYWFDSSDSKFRVYERYEFALRSIQNTDSFLEFILNGNFEKAIAFKNQDSGMEYFGTKMIDKALSLSCHKLIREGEFEEVEKLIVLMEKNCSGTTRKENVLKDLAIEFVKLDRFDEAFECAKKLDVDRFDSEVRMAAINAALCEKGKFEEAREINQISIREKSDCRNKVISIYKYVLVKNFDSAIHELWNMHRSDFEDEMYNYISRKLFDAGQIEKAIKCAFRIKDPVIKNKTLKMFS
jgi:tetratricopeptide (TPR) repeat protein